VNNEDGATTGDSWSIEPATVTINTLTINGKQVTLDVFRQLKEAALINHDGSLAGSPWGLVNYHQKRCDKLKKHAHVVWQLDDQLRQETIQPPRFEPYRSDTCDALVFAYGTVERLPSTTSGPPPEDPVRSRQSRPSWLRLAARAILMLFQPPPDVLQPPPEEPQQPPPEEPQQPPPADPEAPARFHWIPPEFGETVYPGGSAVLIFQVDGMECTGRRLRQNRWGGPDMAAEHSTANRNTLLASSRMRLPPRRSAGPSTKRDGPKSSTCRSCSSPSRTTSPNPCGNIDSQVTNMSWY
jgi:hypothetical protein